jgi:carboxypeptidase C (cathepsin A)
MRNSTLAVLLSVLVCGAAAARADEGGAAKGDKGGDKAPAASPAAPRKFVTHHHFMAGGVDIPYTATAEDIDLKDHDGKPTARFFTISYIAEGTKRQEDRPITFFFNGGPGSSSVWLHLGFVGPKRIDIPSDAQDPGAPPYRLKDNPSSLLRATDLVEVDPVGTGFSRALGDKKDADFWGYDEDADSVAEFIRAFLTVHDRWNSPKYVLGESYGGIRASLLVPRLQGRFNIGLNGVILISPAINMGALPFVTNGNDLTYATHLPTLAATAWYHKRLPDQWPSQQALLTEVEQFASGEYLQALFKGDALPAAEKDQIADKLHRYTGLSKQYILNSDLRIYAPRFAKELLRDEGKAIGFLDARYAQKELDNAAEQPNNDAFNAKTGGIYVALFQQYLRDELKADIDEHYEPQNGEANQSWKRPKNGGGAFFGFVDTTGDLAQGTKDNEALRVFAANGYYDLATAYFANAYMLHHSGIDPARMTLKVYPAGHMMYLHQPSLEALSNDVVSFIQGK